MPWRTAPLWGRSLATLAERHPLLARVAAVARIQEWYRALRPGPAMEPRARGEASRALFRKYVREMDARRSAHTGETSESFDEWCACKVQSVWRMRCERTRYVRARFAHYAMAATVVQRAWRACVRAYKSRADVRDHAARVVQNAWLRFSQRRVYHYYRGLVLSRENSDPAVLLRVLNEQDDPALALVARFRLGGHSFPPKIYYKVYTRQNVADINAFAPRNYARERAEGGRRRRQGDDDDWYRRAENNGWRLVAASALSPPDEVEAETASKRQRFPHSALTRRADRERERKERRREWLRKMYVEGKRGESAKTPVADEDGSDWEREADELLEWTARLGVDWDSYHEGWQCQATSRATDSARRTHGGEGVPRGGSAADGAGADSAWDATSSRAASTWCGDTTERDDDYF